MRKQVTFQDGELLLYTGEGFEEFDSQQPYMDFLGYESSSWTDLWVSYNGVKMRIQSNEVEIARRTGT